MDRVFRELLEAVILATIVFLLIHTSIRNFKVEGSSMNPTLESGQHLIVNKLVYSQLDMDRLSRIIPFWQAETPDTRYAIHPPKRGEVIVFHFPRDPSKDFVKRVIGLPGEEVEIRQGKVYINGQALTEPYLDRLDNSRVGPMRLREKEYFVLGDNRRSSNDSRIWGPVSETYVVGKVWFVYWPFSKVQLLDGITQ
jgi:signal peptidase I